jgi:hypothetical protein
MTSDKWKLRI